MSGMLGKSREEKSVRKVRKKSEKKRAVRKVNKKSWEMVA